MSTQDKVKKGQRKSTFCGHFMADWDDHHYCPKCRDDFKGDDPCANSSDCLICSSFSEQKKIRNRNRYKSKKDQNSSVFVDNNKEGSVDDSLLDKDESAVSVASQALSSQKNKSLEDKLDRFFSEFASFSQRLQNLEQKGAETVSSRNSGRDSLHVAKQPVESTKASSSALSSVLPGRGDRRSATLTRTEFEQQASASHTQQEAGSGSSRKRTLSQSSEDPDPDVEQGEICNLEDDSPAYSETLKPFKNGWIWKSRMWNALCLFVFSGRDQVKKSAQQSMALPPAQPLVDLWRYKEFSALGSNNVDDNDPHHPPLSKGQFLSFPKPQMRFYQVSPQSFSLAAPRIQDAFKNIASSPYQAPTSVVTPMKQYLAWESVSRETIQILNHVFWFKSAIEKSTNEMFSEVAKMKESVDQEDIQQSMNFIQNCLHLQSTTMGCLGKALDDVLDTSNVFGF